MQIDREVLREVEAVLDKVAAAWFIAMQNNKGRHMTLGEISALAKYHLEATALSRAEPALASLRKAMGDGQDAADAQKALDELICECGMTGPCMYSECKSPLLSCKAMEDGKDG